jgi:dTDP-4-amino-4,6-dideoxygalactose transaminase
MEQQVIPLSDPGRYFAANLPELTRMFQELVNSKHYILGQLGMAFEDAFSKYLSCDHAVAVANGTDALAISLLACDVTDREVILAPNAGGYAANATVAAGATPRWVDVDSTSLLLDIDQVLEQVTERTGAVVATHLYGNPVDVDRLVLGLRAMNREDVNVIEDCAQSHGGELRGKKLGTIGRAGCFSFYPTKNLGTIGDGGLISTSDGQLAARIRSLRQYGWDVRYRQSIRQGRNSRLDELHAAILLHSLGDLDSRNNLRREILDRYRQIYPSLVGGLSPEDFVGVGHLAVLRVSDRDDFIRQLSQAEVSTSIHYPYLDSDMPAFERFSQGTDLSVARKAVNEIVTIPCFPEMTSFEIDQVCDSLRAYSS